MRWRSGLLDRFQTLLGDRGPRAGAPRSLQSFGREGILCNKKSLARVLRVEPAGASVRVPGTLNCRRGGASESQCSKWLCGPALQPFTAARGGTCRAAVRASPVDSAQAIGLGADMDRDRSQRHSRTGKACAKPHCAPSTVDGWGPMLVLRGGDTSLPDRRIIKHRSQHCAARCWFPSLPLFIPLSSSTLRLRIWSLHCCAVVSLVRCSRLLHYSLLEARSYFFIIHLCVRTDFLPARQRPLDDQVTTRPDTIASHSLFILAPS